MKFSERIPRTKGGIYTGGAGLEGVCSGWVSVFVGGMACCFVVSNEYQAFQLLAGAPVEEAAGISHTTALDERGFIPNLRKSLACAGHVAGIAALHVFLPGLVPVLERLLCISGLLTAFVRPPKGGAESGKPLSEEGLQIMEWSEFSVMRFLKDLLGQMYGSVCICRVVKEAWGVSHADSFYLAECSVVLMEVDRSYKRLSKAIARGKIVGSTAIEEAWLQAHKRAAQRVAHLLKDLPDTPPLKGLIEYCERNSIELGRGIDGCAMPVHCLSDGHGISIIINLNPRSRYGRPKIAVAPQSMRRRVPQQLGPVKRPSVHPIYSRHPVSEISEFPLEAELDELSSDDDTPRPPTEQIKEVILPLYGRQDHNIEDPNLSVVEKVELSLRGMKLFFAFLPFILLGVFLLLIAYSLDFQTQQSKKKRRQVNYLAESSRRQRWVNKMRTAAFERLLQGCRDGGAAFIKWGQWSSSREDLFPAEFCDVLSALHDQAPVHSMRQTRKEILKSFGRPIEDIFEAFEHQPLASGSVAQVHRALYKKDGVVIPVIVKVRHPNVGQQIHQDFQILKPLAGMASKIPSLKNLPLKESVCQFSNTMTAQTDFRVEAAHIKRFGRNFEPVKNAVVIPQIIEELVSESVLVETYEEGLSVARFIKAPSEMNTKIVTLGVDAYLKMLLTDNFVHTDLHPGNILVREVEHLNGEKDLQIVLLDFGLAEELRPEIRKHFISFLNLISKGDGYNAARHLLQWSTDQQCPNPKAFIDDMKRLFATECDIYSLSGIDLDAVMKSVLRLARKHNVSIDSGYASLVIGVCIIVGFAHSLDPRVNLMDAATPVLLTYALTGRVVGRLYG